MSYPFAKIACFTDIHYGRSSGSMIANQDNMDFIDWFIDEAKTWGAESCAMLGDFFDNRASLPIASLNYGLQAIEKLNANFKKVFFIVGNHDLLYRDKREVSSTMFARNLNNIVYVNEPLVLGDGKEKVTFLPWLVQGEQKRLKKYTTTSRYIFGHLEISGGSFLMNAKVPIPDHTEGTSINDLVGPEMIMSGHFHFRQAKKVADTDIVYIGNTFPFNFADDWDEDRGMMMLEWGKEPIFKSWPGQPLFRTMTLSEMLLNPDKLLCDKLTARVTLDIDISYEEGQAVKDEFAKKYGVRKLELMHAAKETVDQTFSSGVTFQTVDQIVMDGLNSVESNTIDPKKLINIYNDLH